MLFSAARPLGGAFALGRDAYAVFGAPRELPDKERAAVETSRETVREVPRLEVPGEPLRASAPSRCRWPPDRLSEGRSSLKRRSLRDAS